MPRPRKDMTTATETVKPDEMPLETQRDYRLYNEAARAANKGKKEPLYPIKPCPEDLHPTERIIFNRKDQPNNPMHVRISDEHIDFKKTLVPGQTYDLPKYVISVLESKGKAIWGEVEQPDGTLVPMKVSKDPRVSLQRVYTEYYD